MPCWHEVFPETAPSCSGQSEPLPCASQARASEARITGAGVLKALRLSKIQPRLFAVQNEVVTKRTGDKRKALVVPVAWNLHISLGNGSETTEPMNKWSLGNLP